MRMGMAPTEPVILFANSIQFTDTCWLWTHSKNQLGYGLFGVGSMTDGTRRRMAAHRWSYQYWVGPIPAGLVIDHLCRVPSCVRPEHLEAVTNRENSLRGIRGRLTTHCPQGHEYTAVTTYMYHGRRYCRPCHRDRENVRHTGSISARTQVSQLVIWCLAALG